MIVVVTGGRKYSNKAKVFDTLDALHHNSPIHLLIHGGATGADYLASRWAEAREVNCLRVPAKWSIYDKAAGPIRNQEMLDLGYVTPEICVVFPGNNGTADMKERASKTVNMMIEVKDEREEL